MDHHYSTDQPISHRDEDRFQRYEFAKRIANTIINRKGEDGIVIGIFGAWGEGKTSILNFIEKELTAKECIPVRFNPWRYAGEELLLEQFFKTLASELKTELLTSKEKRGNWLKKIGRYSKGFKTPIGDIGDLFANIGSTLNSTEIEKLKERINLILKREQKKVIVFIDDIDRLNKDEIHAVFRLVKLNADFTNTTYILSFDEEMVAAAIGERFGDGNISAGRAFLEKIIQVRLTLPKVQRDALRNFQLELINRVIDQNGFDINERNAARFVGEFEHLLLRLKTPRQASQFANSISFSIPLLQEEVNISDLLLIEGVKIFYPDHYEFIKNSPEYFISGYSLGGMGEKKEAKITRLKERLDGLAEGLTYQEKDAIIELLTELFPKLKEALDNQSYSSGVQTSWFKNKLIASPHYFERYFSYCVVKGQISDAAFSQLRDHLHTLSVEKIAENIADLIHVASDSAFVNLVRIYEDEYSWEEGCALIRGIILNGELLKRAENNSLLFSFETSRGQAHRFIYQIFKKYQKEVSPFDRVTFAKEILRTAKPFDFRFDILEEIGTNVVARMVFDFEELKELHAVYRDIILEHSNGKPIFIDMPFEFYRISEYWKDIDKESLESYVKETLDEARENVIFFLRSFTSFIYSTSVPQGYYSDFSESNFSMFADRFDLEFIKSKLLMCFSPKEIDEKEVIWVGNESVQTDINIGRQFLHWYNKLFNELPSQ